MASGTRSKLLMITPPIYANQGLAGALAGMQGY